MAGRVDERGDELLKKLQGNDFEGVISQSEAAVRAALPPEKLKAVWSQLTSQLGALQSWSAIDRTEKQGKDVRIYSMKFERGQLNGVVAIDPTTLLLVGLHFSPAAPRTKEPRREQTPLH